MATIKISDLHTAGSELLLDSESYLNELTHEEGLGVLGGEGGFTFGGGKWYVTVRWSRHVEHIEQVSNELAVVDSQLIS
jgi:hypothetical protein